MNHVFRLPQLRINFLDSLIVFTLKVVIKQATRSIGLFGPDRLGHKHVDRRDRSGKILGARKIKGRTAGSGRRLGQGIRIVTTNYGSRNSGGMDTGPREECKARI